MDLCAGVSNNMTTLSAQQKCSSTCRSMDSQADLSIDNPSTFPRQRSFSICKSIDALTVSLLDHAPSSLQSMEMLSPKLSLLEMPEYKYLKVLQAFREKHVFELGRTICTSKCRYCDPNPPVFDIFNETKKLTFPTPNELMFWDSLHRCILRSQWGHWPQVYQILPKFKRRQLALYGHQALLD